MGGSVYLPVRGIPVVPSPFVGRVFVKYISFVRLISGGGHDAIGKGDKDVVADGEAIPCGSCLGFLHNINVTGDALGLFVERQHVGLDDDVVGGVNTAAISTDVLDDLVGSDERVVGGRYFNLTETRVIVGGLEEGNATIFGFGIEGAVVALGSVCHLFLADF